MTQTEYKEHFSALLKAEITRKGVVYTAVKIEDVGKHVDRSIGQGLKDFWSAWDWSFKTKEYELAITSQDNSYDLPSDCDTIMSVREKNSGTGLSLMYRDKEEFDKLIPKESLIAAGNPELFTVFWDGSKKKISFYRRPSNQTIYILYHRTPPTDVSAVPPYGHACLESFIAKHVYPHGHPSRNSAIVEASVEMSKLQVRDRQNVTMPSVMMTETDSPSHVNPYWWTITS